MINTSSISSAQNNRQLSNQRTIPEEIKLLESMKIGKSTDEKDTVRSAEEKYDRYIESNGQEKTPGIYRLEKDENGNPQIVLDRTEGEPENAPANTGKDYPDIADLGEDGKKPEPENDPKKKVEVGKSVGDDSRWKAEIEKINQKKSQLSQEISNVRDDENKRAELEAQLAQVEAELAAKDTEAYRKQCTVIRYLGSQMMDAADAAKLD